MGHWVGSDQARVLRFDVAVVRAELAGRVR
jgi:hypothetical protein